MDNNTRNAFRASLAFILGSSLFALISCTKDAVVQRDEGVGEIKQIGNYMEYEKEGFITKDLFRVVIVEPRGGKEPDSKEIRKTAERRALSSMEHYLVENGIMDDRNAKAVILNLIGDHGKLKEAPLESGTRTVYLFDIEKPDLKQQIDNLPKAR